MKIVVLDGYCLNPGDLSWEELEDLGDLTVYERTSPEEVWERARNADVILTNKTIVKGEVIEKLPKLKFIGLLATGYNVVDIEAARKRKIPVSNVPTYGTESVAQMVFAHLLNLTQHVAHHAQTVREGRWTASKDFCYWDYPLVELAGLVMGIVGFGRTGQALARLALSFGMKVLAHEPMPPPEVLKGVELVPLDRIFQESDVVSLHCPLVPETERMVNHDRLASMKRSAFLINTSRGPLVDEEALARALNEDRIAGAGLDVLDIEPPEKDNPLFRAKNCFITPHIAWANKAARERLFQAVKENVEAFLRGNPKNVVNP